MKHTPEQRAVLLAHANQNAADLMQFLFIGVPLIVAFWTVLWAFRRQSTRRQAVAAMRAAHEKQSEIFAKRYERAMRFKRQVDLKQFRCFLENNRVLDQEKTT